MTEHKKHPHDAVIRAWLDGKAVQYRGAIPGEWHETLSAAEAGYMSMPQFRATCEYRIKPETIRYRVALVGHGNNSTPILATTGYEFIEASPGFLRWLGPEQEVEV